MQTKLINREFTINNVPLEDITIEKSRITISLDDINGKRFRLIFTPYQAINTTTIDCVDVDSFFNEECVHEGRYQRHIIEVIHSVWIENLKKILKENDEDAVF